MAHVGRALRQKQNDERREERHGADLALMRKLDREFAEQAVRDREVLFPVITATCARQALRFQEERIQVLRKTSDDYQAALARVS